MMAMTDGARRARKQLRKSARRLVTVLKRQVHRADRRAVRQHIKIGTEDVSTIVTHKVTERDVH